LGAVTGNQAVESVQVGLRQFIVQVGKWQVMATPPVKCTLIRAYTRLTRSQKW